jgi:hypothetical protein
MRWLVVLVIVLVASPVWAGKDRKVRWKAWRPPAACNQPADADDGKRALEVVEVGAGEAKAYLGTCDHGVDLERTRLVAVRHVAVNSWVRRVKKVTSKKGRLRIVVEVESACRGAARLETSVVWVKLPRGAQPIDVDLVSAKVSDAERAACSKVP